MDVVAAGTLAFDAIAFQQNLRSVPLRASPNTDPIWLTRGSSIDRQPAFSPDGDSVIFASNRSRNLDLWVLSRKDGSLKRLTDDAHVGLGSGVHTGRKEHSLELEPQRQLRDLDGRGRRQRRAPGQSRWR